MRGITTVNLASATEAQRPILEQAQQARGGILGGMAQVMAADPQLGSLATPLYRYLNLRPGSPVPKLQREMIATLVNGLVGGKP